MTDEKGFENLTEIAIRFGNKMIDELGLEDAFLATAMMKISMETKCMDSAIFEKETIMNGILKEKKLIEEWDSGDERTGRDN